MVDRGCCVARGHVPLVSPHVLGVETALAPTEGDFEQEQIAPS